MYSLKELKIDLPGATEDGLDSVTLSDLKQIHDGIFKKRDVNWFSVSLPDDDLAELIALAISKGKALTNEALRVSIPEGAVA